MFLHLRIHFISNLTSSTTVWQIPDAVDTVVCAPDDGWRYHPKHVEQFPDINKLCKVASCWIYIEIYFIMIYLLTAIGLSSGGSTHLHTNSTWNNTITTEQHKITTNVEECEPCPVFASFTLAFALQLRKKHGKPSVRLRKTSVRVQYTYYQNTHTLQNPQKHTQTNNRCFFSQIHAKHINTLCGQNDKPGGT